MWLLLNLSPINDRNHWWKLEKKKSGGGRQPLEPRNETKSKSVKFWLFAINTEWINYTVLSISSIPYSHKILVRLEAKDFFLSDRRHNCRWFMGRGGLLFCWIGLQNSWWKRVKKMVLSVLSNFILNLLVFSKEFMTKSSNLQIHRRSTAQIKIQWLTADSLFYGHSNQLPDSVLSRSRV